MNHKNWFESSVRFFRGVMSPGFMAMLLVLAVAQFSVWAEEQGEEPERKNRQGLLLTVDDVIGPATMDYIVRGVERAEAEDFEIVILRMDTPGGLMASMRGIIMKFLSSSVPVATYVSPAGARAASAGTFILYGSHIAAMAPATNLGSATPVRMGGMPGTPDERNTPGEDEESGQKGQDEPRDGEGEGEEKGSRKKSGGSALERKTMEDAVAYIRELAVRHGRNADWAERAVREAVNLGATDALEMNVIDIVAEDIDELLTAIDGRSVTMKKGEYVLQTADVRMIRHDPDWRTRLLMVITNPNVAYFLMIIGFYGIIFELSNPGSLFPGVLGGICLILALYSFQVLSVNYAGLALIMLGLAFIVAEAFIPSFGILGIGGIAAFVVGSVILMDGSHLAVSLPIVGGTAVVASVFLLWVVTRFFALRSRKAVSGIDQMVEKTAIAIDDFQRADQVYSGRIRLSGERWNAVCKQPVNGGEKVSIQRIEGLTAHVVKDGARSQGEM